MAEPSTIMKSHTVIIENRNKITLSGVCDVEQFDADHLLIKTEQGQVEIRGENIQVTKLSLESGDMAADGMFDSISYSENMKQNSGLFSKLLR